MIPGSSISGAWLSNTANPSVTARLAAGIFFPRRPGLRLNSHNCSPSVLGKILRSAARDPSFQEAAAALDELADLTISSRQLTRIAHEVGQELKTNRDQRVHDFQNQQLMPTVATRPALAVVQVDGGRLQVRGEGAGPGTHDAAWHEDKIAVLATAAITVSNTDPEPDWPACFRDRKFVEGLARGIRGQGPLSGPDPPADSPADSAPTACETRRETRKRPELLVRTDVASTCFRDRFGPMVAAFVSESVP